MGGGVREAKGGPDGRNSTRQKFRVFFWPMRCRGKGRLLGSIANRIVGQIQAYRPRGWVCTPRDFLDIGDLAAIGKALSRLVAEERIRRVGRGLYARVVISRVLKRPAPISLDAAIAAIARRDNIRILPDGLVAANQFGLTNVVPAKANYWTIGVSRTIKIDGWSIRLRHAHPTIMNWADRPAAPVVLALHWLGTRLAKDPQIVTILRKRLPDTVKRDLWEGMGALPTWMLPIVRQVISRS